MIPVGRMYRAAFAATAILTPALPISVQGQLPVVIGKDSVTVQAGAVYAAGGLHRFFFGDNYRDQWTTPIRVPVLDLGSFDGGITPTKVGGGRQTKSLRMVTPDSSEYVFRPVFKAQTILPDQYKGTIIWKIFRDQASASHPAGTVAAAPVLAAVDLLHPTPRLAVMPDDARLGEFRKDFAGLLGTIEEYPAVPKRGRAFAGASSIIDADELLEKLDRNPSTQVDARAFLRARLVDLFLNDNDRHPDQWKWARLGGGNRQPWAPIPRDRDKIFVTYEGLVLDIARNASSALVEFGPRYPRGSALFENAMEFDRRLLGGLDKSVWNAEAVALQRTITDDVISQVTRAMPPEYAQSSAAIGAILNERRAGLPDAANRYYAELWSVAELHGTNAGESAIVTRARDGFVTVQLQAGNELPHLTRRFDPGDTKEIRVYLHGGDDRALVTGDALHSIKVRIIGGNGTNTFEDGSTVAGERNPTRLYDTGAVAGVRYDADTASERSDPAMARNNAYNRRPWLSAYGSLIPPQRDRGTSTEPVVGVRSGHGIGIVPRAGIERTTYAFRHLPYKNRIGGDIAYSVVHRGFAAGIRSDTRYESSDIHVPAEAGVSQLDIVQFRGFGNDIPERDGKFYDARQTAWHFRPAIARSLNSVSDISIGPIIRYTTTDSASNRFITEARPYGFAEFRQAGLQAKLHYDTRQRPDTMRPRAVIDLSGSGYPGFLDATTAYQSVEGAVTAYINIPVATRPVVALRAGGKKLSGDFPYFDAAFLGGGSTLRTEYRQRYAGDASLFGSAELRVPVAKFPFLLPLDVGLLGFTEAGRVYLYGESPGGWHTAGGAGFWIGFVDPGTSVNVLVTNKRDRRTMVSIGFAY